MLDMAQKKSVDAEKISIIQNAGMEITGVYCDSRVVVDTRAIIEEMEIAIGKENERKELAKEGKRKKSKGKGREEVARERKRM